MDSHTNGNAIHANGGVKKRLAKRRLFWTVLLLGAAVAGQGLYQGSQFQSDGKATRHPEQSRLETIHEVNVSKETTQKKAETNKNHKTTLPSSQARARHHENELAMKKRLLLSDNKNEADFSLPYGEPIIVELILNNVVRGSFPVIIEAKNNYYIRGEDLKSIGVMGPYGAPTVKGGDDYFSLTAMGATRIDFDESRLALSADLPAEKLTKQEINFLGKRSRRVEYQGENSAFLNYRVMNSGSDSYDDETWIVGGELGIHYRDVLFRNESAYIRHNKDGTTIRYGTSITHDDRQTLQRLIVGDFFASSGNLGTAMNFGGISFSKSYSINPDFVKQPMAGFVTTVSSPSEVEIYLDDMRLRSEKIDPGQFEFKNLNYYGGRHDLKMLIRDSFGREQVIAYPYYFSNRNLRQGLHDYSYNVGRIRTGVGTSHDEYGEWAVSAYHQYGFSNSITAGGRSEVGGGVVNVGPNAIIRLDRWGVLSGSVALSRSEKGVGWAASAGYGYQQRDFHLQTYWRRYANDYEVVGRTADSDRPEQEVMAAAGYAFSGIGNVGLSLRQLTQYQGLNQKVVSLTYSRTLDQRFRLMAAATHTEIGQSSNYVYIGLSYQPGHSINTMLRHQQTDKSYGDAIQIGNTTPIDEGFGYRFTAEHNVTEYDESVRLSPWAQYNGRHAIYTANVQNITNTRGESVTGYQWGVSGGIGFVGNTVSFSRPISDSFALVDMGGIEGVRVYQSAREIGRTDENGNLFIPDLHSYQVNRIAVDDRDIPIDYSINTTEVFRAPPLRSGSVVRFDVRRHQAVSGRLFVKLGTVWLPAEFVELAIEVDGTSMVVPTGHGGEFYLENLQSGHYRANFVYRNNRCDFDLNIPESGEMMIELGELSSCEFPQ